MILCNCSAMQQASLLNPLPFGLWFLPLKSRFSGVVASLLIILTLFNTRMLSGFQAQLIILDVLLSLIWWRSTVHTYAMQKISLQFVQQMIQNLPMGSFRNTVGQTGSHFIGQTLSVNHWCISCVLTLRFQAISSTMVLSEYVIITTTDGVANILVTKVHLHTFSSEQ